MGISPDLVFEQWSATARQRARIALAIRFDLESRGGDGNYVEVWRIGITSRWANHVWLKVPRQFPLELPVAFVDDRSLFGLVPHVNDDGEVCFCDKATATYKPDNIPEVILWVAEQAIRVLDFEESPEADNEFASEFYSYWKAPHKFLSLLNDLETLRTVNLVWIETSPESKFSFLASDDPTFATRWLGQSGLGRPAIQGTALFLPGILPMRPPLPITNEDMFNLVKGFGGVVQQQWESYLRKNGDNCIVLSTVASSRGKSLIAWRHPRVPFQSPNLPGGVKGNQAPGFRPGREPLSLEMKGRSSTAPLEKFEAVRVDIERLRARTVGANAEQGFRHLLVIGVGAIGSHVLMGLATSHLFDQITIVDPDILKVENVLRHAASFDGVGQSKARVLGDMLGRKCPWLSIDVFPEDVLDCLPRLSDLIGTVDLVVMATGATAVERFVTTELLASARPGVAIHRLWFTVEADEGHIVRYVSGQVGCPKCCVDAPPPRPASIQYEPGCSPGFATFGGSRLQRFSAVATDAVLSRIEGGWHQLWTARQVDSQGATDVVERTLFSTEAACSLCDK